MRRRFVVRFALALLLAPMFTTPARALGPDDLFSWFRNSLRFLWVEEGSSLDSSGRPTVRSNAPKWIWESTGSSLDPSGRPAPPSNGVAWLGQESGSSIDPNGGPTPAGRWNGGSDPK